MLRAAGPLDFMAVDAELSRYRAKAAPEHADEAAYEPWLAAFWARFGQDPPLAYLHGDDVALLGGTIEHRIVLDSAPALLPDLVAGLRADPRTMAITLPAGYPPLAGFRSVERWEHHFDLRFGPADPGPAPAGYRVEPWQDAHRAEAARLLAAANAGRVDGVFLTWPDPASPERCLALLDGFLAGSHGPFSPETSFMAFHGDRLAALTLVSLPSAEEALLFEIAAGFRHRGTGLAARLLDGIKATLRPRGYRTVRFLACGANAAVLALFRPEEVRSERIDGAWMWLRD